MSNIGLGLLVITVSVVGVVGALSGAFVVWTAYAIRDERRARSELLENVKKMQATLDSLAGANGLYRENLEDKQAQIVQAALRIKAAHRGMKELEEVLLAAYEVIKPTK